MFCISRISLGFLIYNSHPAKCYEDTGSLVLGATLVTIAVLTDHELTLLSSRCL